MAVELYTGALSAGTAANNADIALQEGAAGKTKAAGPVLGGKAVNVTSGAASDLEKLVAQLKNESAEVRQSVAQRHIAILNTVLSSMAERVTDEQRAAFAEMQKLESDLAQAQADKAKAETGKAAAETRSLELDMQIKALEKAVEQAVEDGKDHREKIQELKKQKAEEDAKIARFTNAIVSAQSKIDSANAGIGECVAAIGAATLGEVASAIRAAAGEVHAPPEKTETTAEETKKELKMAAFDPAAAIRDALDKIDADILETIEEKREVTV